MTMFLENDIDTNINNSAVTFLPVHFSEKLSRLSTQYESTKTNALSCKFDDYFGDSDDDKCPISKSSDIFFGNESWKSHSLMKSGASVGAATRLLYSDTAFL